MRCNPAAALACAALLWAASGVARAQDMPLSQVLIDGEPWEQVAEGYKLTAGAAADAEGNVYFSEPSTDRILKIDIKGKLSVLSAESEGAAGLACGPDGKLYACQTGRRQIVAYNAAGAAAVVATGIDARDLAISAKGLIYCTDPAGKRVWHIDSAGKKHVVDETLSAPSGVVFWGDGRTLVVSDPSSTYLWTYRVEADGSLAHKQGYYFLRTSNGLAGSGADGMMVDRDGRLFCATQAGLQVFDPTGRESGLILKPSKAPLGDVVLGGADLNTLYITAGDKIFRRATKTKALAAAVK